MSSATRNVGHVEAISLAVWAADLGHPRHLLRAAVTQAMDVVICTAMGAVVNASGNAEVVTLVIVVVASAQLVPMAISSSLQCGTASASVHSVASRERTDVFVVPTIASVIPNSSAKSHVTS